MTSIAEPAHPPRGPSWARTLLVAALLGLLAAQTPGAWAVLWLAVLLVTAVAMLVTWRFGPWGLLVPVLAAGGALAAGPSASLWAWWCTVAALSGAWTGWREEGGRNTAGARAWRLVPVLALAVALPWHASWPRLQSRTDAAVHAVFQETITTLGQSGYSADRLAAYRRSLEEADRLWRQLLPYLLPTGMFLWVAMLVGAGRLFASRTARSLRWPPLTRSSLIEWRLPDGALWVFLAGLAILVLAWAPAAPSGWTLLINAGLGFSVQGIAVVVSLLLARGIPAALINVTMLFLFAMASTYFVVTAMALGLSDAWLDYRRLEPTADGGDH